jgi:hypothetical protein
MKQSRLIIFATLIILFSPVLSFALFLGPYSGTVMDAKTGAPVEGACVLFYWEKRIPTPPTGGSPELIDVKLLYTDKKGRYEIPRILANLGLLGHLESTHVIIYQPGYQAYIIRVWHDTERTDRSFKEKDNSVKLERIPPNFNHKEHYRRIEEALWGIRESYDYSDEKGSEMIWNKLLQINLKTHLEKDEFLRRVEWEERRGLSEEQR